MIIGVPKEIKNNENRIAIVPAGVDVLKRAGHTVLIEADGGLGSGIHDEEYAAAGAEIVKSAADVWGRAQMIMKVKEPLASEYGYIRADHTIFTYFHFAASKELTDAIVASGCTAIAYETVEDEKGRLPLLTPMSEIAGRMSIQEGAKYLEKPMMGRGILLGGIPGVAPAEVLVIGGGIVGSNAAKVAAGLGARVTVLDIDLDRLRYLDDVMPRNVVTLFSNQYNIREKALSADLVIGAVLTPGARAPVLIPKSYLKDMKNGSVIIDVAVDQGGCVETCKPTTHDDPTYIVDGVVHYCVANMPGAVGRTSTYGLTNVTLKYARLIADLGAVEAARRFPGLRKGVDIRGGKILQKGVAEAFGYSHTRDLEPVLV
jgi:alanine dehydrogenase